MFEILRHPDLTHQPILVSVHASQVAHMSEYVLQSISQLEGFYITEAVLDVRIHDQLD
jgi:hypothetical protein